VTSFPVSASRRGGGTVGQDTCTSQDGGPGRGWVKFFGEVFRVFIHFLHWKILELWYLLNVGWSSYCSFEPLNQNVLAAEFRGVQVVFIYWMGVAAIWQRTNLMCDAKIREDHRWGIIKRQWNWDETTVDQLDRTPIEQSTIWNGTLHTNQRGFLSSWLIALHWLVCGR